MTVTTNAELREALELARRVISITSSALYFSMTEKARASLRVELNAIDDRIQLILSRSGEDGNE